MANKFPYLIILLSAVMFSCHHHHDEAHEHEHEHEHEVQLQLTGYSERFEVYAEADPFVVGEECCVLAHITRLETFKPLAKGPITVVLTVNGKSVKETLDEPEEPGVFDCDITPNTKGKGVLTFYVEGDTIEIGGIQVFDDEEAAHEDAEAKQAKSNNSATFTKEQSWKVNFSTELCRVEPFGQVIKTSAQVMPSQGDEQVMVAKSAGIVLMTNGDVVVGKAVAAGQTLFSVSGGDMVDNNLSVRVQEASAEYNRAKSEYERKQELAKDKIVSESELQRSRSEYESAAAVFNNLKRSFAGGKTSVSAPMAGFIKQIFIQNGQYVEAGQPIASVSKNKNLFIQADVQSKYYPMLANIASANFKIGGQVYSLQDLNGRVVSYGKSTSTENPLVPVIFQVSNTVDLLPGSFVETYIRTSSEQQVVTVPTTALVEEMSNYFVYVQLTPELFDKREVTIGVTDGRRTEIKSGLTGKERVVGKGAVLVKLAQAAGKLDAHSGHHH